MSAALEVWCDTPFGRFELRRPGVDRTGSLRAWDGADLLLLDHVDQASFPAETKVLVVGDRFGALAVALRSFSPVVWCESKTAEYAIVANHKRADLSHQPVIVRDSEQVVACGPFDLVIWNVERSTELVRSIAGNLASWCHRNSVVVAAGMDKHLPPKTGEILRSVGTVTTFPGSRKAHLFETRVAEGNVNFLAPPVEGVGPVNVPEFDLHLTCLPGVFSAERFDLGTRLLAQQVHDLHQLKHDARRIVDLGCGSGALGILALRSLPSAHVWFVDESARAIESSRRNVNANLGPDGLARASFVHSDVFADVHADISELDLVVCNPPFHAGNAMNDEVAWTMFSQSHRRLAVGGELWVVGNRHMGYHASMQRLFGNAFQHDAHPKFVVLASRKV